MFNYIIWGGYLIGTLHPQHLIFISTQQDAYGETLNVDYRTIENTGPGWDTLLARYDAGWVIERPDVPLVQALRRQPGRSCRVRALGHRQPGIAGGNGRPCRRDLPTAVHAGGELPASRHVVPIAP